MDESGGYESCVRYDHNYSTLTSGESCDTSVNESSLVTVPCDAWQYDRTHLTETIVTEVRNRGRRGTGVEEEQG